jgi:septal ring factor EnvC (AmiA/AmiB activator)
MQSEPSLTQTTQAPKKFNSLIIVVVILVLALAGAGFWGFQQSSLLKTTQSDLAALQGKYDSLTADKNKLTTDLGAAKTELESTMTELEKTQGDLSTSQDDLKNSQDQNTGLQTKIEAAGKKAEILQAFSAIKTPTDILALDSMIKATNDAKLISEWNKFTTSPTTEGSTNFLLYLMASIGAELK